MLFTSLDFGIFLPIVFSLYWIIPRESTVLRNLLLLFSSYVFYAWWDWRFLSLIIISSAVDYLVGIAIAKNRLPTRRKAFLVISILTNLGLLSIFKYCNFFLDNLVQVFSIFGVTFSSLRLDIVLPVGISFYTFQTMSYTIDIYRRKLNPTYDPISFFAYVAFFPQLVAGPIERATNLLPQFFLKKTFQYTNSVDGLRQILWGLFKKLVIADNCATIVDVVFATPTDYSASTLAFASVAFSLQIYGDFSGYSDIAIGTARLFGFNLRKNFDFPYFSRNIADFWRRWHMSLTSWFRDYLYIPLGGSRDNMLMTVRNTLVVFVISGIWHGANWTFVLWGVLHAAYFLPLLLTRTNRRYLKGIQTPIPRVFDLFRMIGTFALVDIAWIFFRAPTISDAIFYFQLMFSKSFFTVPELLSPLLLMSITVLILVEWMNRHQAHGLDIFWLPIPTIFRHTGYLLLVMLIILLGGTSESFIYFQF